MKALTIYQPWASFIIAGIKTMETRPIHTNYRGPLAIHAGKLDYWGVRDLLGSERIWLPDGRYDETWFTGIDALEEVCKRHGLPPVACLPRGVVLGTVALTECGKVHDRGGWGDHQILWRDDHRYTPAPRRPSYESALGDYEPGRFAWKVENPVAFPEPVPARGMQGLWEWAEPVEPVEPHGEVTAVCEMDE